MEKITLLLIVALLTAAVNESAAKNLCDGIKDGEKGTNGVQYWRCEGGAIKYVGCEAGFRMSMESQHESKFDTRMSINCVPTKKCQFPGSSDVWKLGRTLVVPDGLWSCTALGIVHYPSNATNMCHYSYGFRPARTLKLKPGNCAYTEVDTKVEIFRAIKQTPRGPVMEPLSEGESPTDCEKWSLDEFKSFMRAPEKYPMTIGSCVYSIVHEKVVRQTFVVECIPQEQNPTVTKKLRVAEVSEGESVAHCEKWSYTKST